MLSGCLIGMPKRVMQLLPLRNVGPREEIDNFVFPPLGPRPTSQGAQPLEKPDTAELPDDSPHGEEELFQEAMGTFMK